ncbi:MAG: zinc-dependent peptidase [Chthoniobacterales bacterium]|nr:zinc-dependent peptidase [Chthoniobacterales bacterium]
MFGFFKNRRRAELRARAVPNQWKEILRRNLPLFTRLPSNDQQELLGHVQVFLAEKNFEGCGGLELTEEIKVTIAAQACVLLLHRETDYYPQLVSILVYPSTYIARRHQPVSGHIWEEGDDTLLGHTQQRLDTVVLAWDAAKRGAADPADGQNLVLHEFAHQLDFEDASTDGAPLLGTGAEYRAWARIMSREFAQLRVAEESGAPSVFDTYGASNPAEFFAVVTEAFFEKPHAVQQRHPQLYTVLAKFFQQDPVRYSAEAAAD